MNIELFLRFSTEVLKVTTFAQEFSWTDDLWVDNPWKDTLLYTRVYKFIYRGYNAEYDEF